MGSLTYIRTFIDGMEEGKEIFIQNAMNTKNDLESVSIVSTPSTIKLDKINIEPSIIYGDSYAENIDYCLTTQEKEN